MCAPPKTYVIAHVEVSGAAGACPAKFPEQIEQDFSPKIVEKNPVKMEENLDMTL